ncbi:hypothetical protein ACFYNF_38335 [Streptomyces sp. NPDC006641]|uniref:hypothetical protein n=1 Tax=unclassified Streptomyces TaxID=2593676 RepID=UPI00368F4E8A
MFTRSWGLPGLLGTGLPPRADSGTAVLADDIRYSLRLTNDDACTYRHTSWQNR